MDNLNLKNLQLSYQAVYDETLCESMDELGLFGDYDYINEVLDTPTLRFSYAKKMLPSALKAFVTGDKNTLKKRSEGAKRGMRKIEKSKKVNEEVELYELILSHLLDEGYSDSLEGAEAIIENMSDEWIEEVLNERLKVFPTQKVAQKAARRYASKDPKKIALADKMTRPEVTQIPWVAYKGGPVGRFVDSGHRKVPSLRDYAKLIARSIKPER